MTCYRCIELAINWKHGYCECACHLTDEVNSNE